MAAWIITRVDERTLSAVQTTDSAAHQAMCRHVAKAGALAAFWDNYERACAREREAAIRAFNG